MAIGQRLRSFIGHHLLGMTTTTLVVLIYIATLGLYLYTDKLSDVPHKGSRELGGIDLELAQRDLKHIAARPHPFNSHSNDVVRSYILGRLTDMAKGRAFFHIDDDTRSNGSWGSYTQPRWSIQQHGVYFEGTNLLVKIDGTADAIGANAVLFSAHYDSVATAPGATDNGMGVASLLQLIEYFASHRQKKTAIFNINNGGQDGSNGAHVFLQHPWSDLTGSFVNLKGAATGGRPMVFRSTSLRALRGFYTAPRFLGVSRPHGNILFLKSFAHNILQSGTDYEVYTSQIGYESILDPTRRSPMEGVDIVSYRAKGRRRLPTRWDDVSTVANSKSLWGMIEYARALGYGLLNEGETSSDPSGMGRKGVYFDVFKIIFVCFSSGVLGPTNAILLVAGPLLLFLLYGVATLMGPRLFRPRDRLANAGLDCDYEPISQETGASSPTATVPHDEAGNAVPDETGSPAYDAIASTAASERLESPADNANAIGRSSSLQTIWVSRAKSSLLAIWMHMSLWIALWFTIWAQAIWVGRFSSMNILTTYSRPYLAFLSSFSLAYLTAVLIIKSGYRNPWLSNATWRHHTILLLHFQLVPCMVIILELVAMNLDRTFEWPDYISPLWYLGLWLACFIGIVRVFLEGAPAGQPWTRQRDTQPSSTLPGDYHDPSENTPQPSRNQNQAFERTPLLSSVQGVPISGGSATEDSGPSESRDSGKPTFDWSLLQVLVVIPVFLPVSAQFVLMGVEEVAQTMGQWRSNDSVYVGISLLAGIFLVPIVPFAPKLHRYLTYLALITFVTTTTYLHVVFPFTVKDPLQLQFQQRVELDPRSVFVDAAYAAQIGAAFDKDATDISRGLPKITTKLSGTPAFLRQVISHLPSTKDKNLSHCANAFACEWESGAGLEPSPGGKDPWASKDPLDRTPPLGSPQRSESYFRANVTHTGASSARISVLGRNTRNCRLYFDSCGIKVVNFTVAGGDERGLPADSGIAFYGLREVRLWSRTWDRTWDVDVFWEPTPPPPWICHSEEASKRDVRAQSGNEILSGRIACEWAEYMSGIGSGWEGVPEDEKPKIPAFEEVLKFLPDWAVATKLDDGLVEAWVPFRISCRLFQDAL